MTRLSRRALLQSGGALLLANSLSIPAANAATSAAVIRLDRNESPFGVSPRVKEALAGLVQRASRYPYDEVSTLRTFIAAHEGVPPECVYVSEGSAELLKLAAILHGAPGRQIIASRPTFPMLPDYAERRGATVAWANARPDFHHDFEAMHSQIGRDTSLIYVCNPNNPTGTLADPDELREFIRTASSRAWVLVDEAYIDFVADPQRASVLDRVRAGDNVMITRSFSKLHGLAGLRIGYGIAQADFIRRLESLRLSFPNVAGVTAAMASLADPDFCAEVRAKAMQSRQLIYDVLDELGFAYVKSCTNFVMFNTQASRPGFVDFARRHGVMVSSVGEPSSAWVRVSLGTADELQEFARVLRAFARRETE